MLEKFEAHRPLAIEDHLLLNRPMRSSTSPRDDCNGNLAIGAEESLEERPQSDIQTITRLGQRFSDVRGSGEDRDIGRRYALQQRTMSSVPIFGDRGDRDGARLIPTCSCPIRGISLQG